MNANSVRGKSDRLFKLVVYTILIFCAACAILPFPIADHLLLYQ